MNYKINFIENEKTMWKQLKWESFWGINLESVANWLAEIKI